MRILIGVNDVNVHCTHCGRRRPSQDHVAPLAIPCLGVASDGEGSEIVTVACDALQNQVECQIVNLVGAGSQKYKEVMQRTWNIESDYRSLFAFECPKFRKLAGWVGEAETQNCLVIL